MGSQRRKSPDCPGNFKYDDGRDAWTCPATGWTGPNGPATACPSCGKRGLVFLDAHEVWFCPDCRWSNKDVKFASAVRVAARYKSKKKVETKDGDDITVYEYSDRQIANRHREKAERVEHLRQHMSDLRDCVRADLKSKDTHKRMVALVVSLMDQTCERVGNDDSAKDGHFGVTGWKVSHVTFKGDKATIKYVGKSGVDHTKTVDHGPTVTALKDLVKGRGKDDSIFDADDAKVTADDVNQYLKKFDVTAKDIRGFRANDEMCKALREVRAKGPKDLPRDRKERDKILKAEFKQALEQVAETVGHEAATLRSQYLVPGLEDEFVKDGTVLKSLKTATKTDAEREDEAVSDLVKPAPKKKPPRHDLRNERVTDDDPDTDTTDDDLSLNFKKVAVVQSLVWLLAERVAHRHVTAAKEHEDAFQTWVKEKKFKSPKSGDEVAFSTLEKHDPKAAQKVRKDWAKEQDKSKDGDKGKGTDSKDDKPKDEPASEQFRRDITDQIQGAKVSLPDDTSDKLRGFLDAAMEGMTKDQAEKLRDQVIKQSLKVIDQKGDSKKALFVPDGMYGKKGIGDTFDTKKSEDAISSAVEARKKTIQDIEEAKKAVKDAEAKLSAAKKDDDFVIERFGDKEVSDEDRAKDLAEQEKSLADLKKKVSTAEATLSKQTEDLSRMVAYHAAMTHYVGHMTDPKKGSSDPAKRVTDALETYDKLSPELASQRKSRVEGEHKRLTRELEKAPADKKGGIQKDLDALDAEIMAVKYKDITSGKADKKDPVSFLVGKTQELGPLNKDVQTLLKSGVKGEKGAAAVQNLSKNLNDDDLASLSGASDLSPMLKGLRESHPSTADAMRSVMMNVWLLQQGDDDDVDRTDAKLKEMSKSFKHVSESKNVPSSQKDKLLSWVKKTVKTVPPKVQVKLKDLFNWGKQQWADARKWEAPKSDVKPTPAVSRVAARFLSYSAFGR